MDNVWLPQDMDTALADVMHRLSIGDELLWTPERLVLFEHWVGHIPFAFWLVKVLRPRLLVELGTHRGNSYCAFCQAISMLRLNSRALAVDTWQGDMHIGREEGLLADLRRHHDPRYDAFSTLLEMTFDAARSHVEPGTVDLLHLDGTHTYDAVRHDFEAWRDSLSSRGVVLFHDISVHREEFGVWRLWAELSQEHPSFAFSHSYGLGMLCLGTDLPTPIQELLALNQKPGAAARVRALFEARGQGIVVRLQAEQMAAERTRLANMLRIVEETTSALKIEHEAERTRLANMLRIAGETTSALKIEHEAERTRLANMLRIAEETASALKEEHTAATAELTEALTNSRNSAEATLGKDAIIRNLRFELDRLARDAAEAQAETKIIREKLIALETSTMWQATWPIRRALEHTSPSVRRAGRRTAKLLWWSATLRVVSKLRDVRPAHANISATGTSFTPSALTHAKVPTIALPDMSAVRAFIPRGRIAAVVHLYYPQVWPELREALGSIHERFDLYVSVTQGAAETALPQIRIDFPSAQIVVFPNRGRDLLPFLTFAASGALNRYDLICKLHSKRTQDRRDGDSWRQTLLGGILRDKDQVRRIVAAFEADPDLGIVVADGHIFGARPEHWVDNRDRVLELGARIGLEHLPEEAAFPGGSIYWIRPFLLYTLLGLNLVPDDFEPEPLPRDGATAHAVERLVGLVCADAGMRIEESCGLPVASVPAETVPVRLVAYYLPQYHPIPENDAWWGKGFTEWTNVTRARPLFRHHRQPRLPTDLGFYDLRVPEVREGQSDLARRYGIGGFCYYYYWFNGQGVLRRPLDEMATSGRPDFPFLICWANEPWSRNWDGGNREVLLPQDYAPGWPRNLAHDIAPLLLDARYIQIDSRPMLLIYRVMHIPDRVAALAELRDALCQLGVEKVHLSGGWVGFVGDDAPPPDPAEVGLDSWFEFPPHRLSAAEITANVTEPESAFSGKIYSYRSAVDNMLAALDSDEATGRHRAVMVGWDNTPRRLLGAHGFHGATPALFRRWLRGVVLAVARRGDDGQQIVFVNAWNEWAEGTYLEPDRDFGHGWLEAVASAVGPGMTRPAAFEAEPKSDSTDELMEGTAGCLAKHVDDAQWLELIIRSAEMQTTEHVMLPAFPAPAWQAQFVGSTNAHAMREAFAFYGVLKRAMSERLMPLRPDTKVLDFGCGWGRFTRLLMKDVASECLHGADVDPDMIGFCRISGLPAQFAVVPALGPTPYGAATFDLIFAYSVFSHLTEDAFGTWLLEFARILRPGGLLVITTQTRRFLEWTSLLRTRPDIELSEWEKSLRSAFIDVDETQRNYDAGRFIFAPTGGGAYRSPSFYGEAVIPEAYIRSIATGSIVLEDFIDDAAVCPQAIAILRRQPTNTGESGGSLMSTADSHGLTAAQEALDSAPIHGDAHASESSGSIISDSERIS